MDPIFRVTVVPQVMEIFSWHGSAEMDRQHKSKILSSFLCTSGEINSASRLDCQVLIQIYLLRVYKFRTHKMRRLKHWLNSCNVLCVWKLYKTAADRWNHIFNNDFELCIWSFYYRRILQHYGLLEFHFIDFKTINTTPKMFHMYLGVKWRYW